MQFEQEILKSYDILGFKPRDKQLENINQIIDAFLVKGFTTVVLSAPTGTGKSIIGAVTAETIHRLRYPTAEAGASFLLTPTNILSDQYHDSFQSDKDPFDNTFRMLKGAGNFPCSALSTEAEPQTGEACAERLFFKEGMMNIIDQHCSGCAYSFQKKMRDKARHLITNYSYYFVDRMYTNLLAKRSVCVFDEVHLLNDLFTEHNAIFFSESRLVLMLKEIVEVLSISDTSIFAAFKKVKEDLINGHINIGNYKTYLQILQNCYKEVFDVAQALAEKNVGNQKSYLKYSKLAKKYFGLGCKIDDLFTYEYAHSFEYKERDIKANTEDELNVKPIFVGDMFNVLVNADYNLLMSATISKTYAERTLALGDKWTHIRLEPSFPKENKKVVFFKTQNLNYTTLRDEKIVKKLQANCFEIVDHHEKRDERGIILAPSFALANGVSACLKTMKVKSKIFEQLRGEKLGDVIKRFKNYDGPAVVITPSGFEGLDLAGDLSRYQIILKAPFASLGDARMKKIVECWPDIYSLICTMKLVQGAGRSVRSKEDWAITYMLDSNIQRLWTAKDMEWSDEFKTIFTTQLGENDE